MERTERRKIGRVAYQAQGVVVVCDTQKVIYADLVDIGPDGVGLTLPADTPDLTGMDVILIADTVIMYADVARQARTENGSWQAGLSARKFSPEVLRYLFESIELKSKYEEDHHE